MRRLGAAFVRHLDDGHDRMLAQLILSVNKLMKLIITRIMISMTHAIITIEIPAAVVIISGSV
jgi:hypothetical protein